MYWINYNVICFINHGDSFDIFYWFAFNKLINW